ncbi:MAG: DnaT-like ssDNA-binding protein [Pseudomonadota bacterium]
MALDVTPGGAASDAYVSLTDADAYHSAHGSAGWTGTDTEKEQAIRRATLWVDGHYQMRFAGAPTNGRSQALQWPRSGVTDIDGLTVSETEIPREIVAATAEAALREIVVPDSLTPDFVKSSADIRREKVGEIEVSYGGVQSAEDVQPVLTKVDQILKPLLTRRTLSGIMAV